MSTMAMFGRIVSMSCWAIGAHSTSGIARYATLVRRPVAIVTDDGRDYEQAHGIKKRSSDVDHSHDGDDDLVKTSDNRKKNKKPGNGSYIKRKLYQKNRDEHVTANLNFAKTMLTLNSKRNDTNNIVLEGQRLIDDATSAGAKILTVFYDYPSNLKQLKNLDKLKVANVRFESVDHKELTKFSHVVTSPGVIAVAERPTAADIESSAYYSNERVKLPLTLILNTLSDPGNMGTVIRTAAAVGLQKIICTERCVNVFDPKVIRSGAGAHFRIPVQSMDWSQLQQSLSANDTQLFYAEKTSSESELYTYVDCFAQKPNVALLIGNEAHGLSAEAKQFVENVNGQRLAIPLAYQTESLNSAIAAAVLVFEIRRQFMAKQKALVD